MKENTQQLCHFPATPELLRPLPVLILRAVSLVVGLFSLATDWHDRAELRDTATVSR